MFSKSLEELTPVVYDETAIKYIRFFPQKKCNCFRLHWHKRIEIIKIVDGTMKIRTGDSVITAQKDEIIIFFPGTPHEGFTEETNAIYDVIMFETSILKNNTPAYKQFIEPFELNRINFSEIIKDSEINMILSELIDKINSPDMKENNLSALYTLAYLYMFFAKFYEKYSDNCKIFKRTESVFEKVIEYINNNYTENISTQSISEIFGYNESYFSRRFKELTGVSSAKYIKILRLEHAKELLKNEKLPISEVAKRSGFNDINYFNRCFKNYYGAPPTKLELTNTNKKQRND